MSRFEILRDCRRGERCILVANSPSLNRMDFSFLRRETVIGMNKMFSGFRKFPFCPRYIARAEFGWDGRRILDATLDGVCDVFEKIGDRTLLRQ